MEPLEYPQQLQDLLAGYVMGDLTAEEEARVNQLLENNPELLTELHRLQSTLAMLPLSLPVSSPPQQLETRILQAAQAQRSPARRSRTGIRPIRIPLWWLVVGSAAVLIAGLGIENHRLNRQLTAAQATLVQIRQIDLVKSRQESRYQEVVSLLRQPNNRFLALTGTRPELSPELQSSGSLVIVPTKDAAILVLRDVAALPKGKVYRMWAFAEGQKVACTDFKPNDKGEVFLQLPLNQWGDTPEVGVTVEPDRVLPKPVGEMVITGS